MPSAEAANLAAVRAVADAVLYKGHRLFRSRRQVGVLGPPAAGRHAFAEPPDMAMQCLVAPADRPARVTIHLRFQQVQVRQAQRRLPDGSHVPVDALTVADVLSSDEAVPREITWPAVPVTGTAEFPVAVPGGADVESVPGGRIVRRRAPLTARVRTRAEQDDGLLRLTVEVANEHPAPVADRHTAARCSLIGAHLLLQAHHAAFVSLLAPPPAAAAAAARCRQHRCWPVLAGRPGSSDVVLGAPIILYDHPEVAGQAVRGTAVLVDGDVPAPGCRTSAVPSRSVRCDLELIAVTETPGEYLDHEPPPAREPMGYRDTGSDLPSAVSTDRPAGVAGADADTGVQPEAGPGLDAPDLRSGTGKR